MSDDGKLIKRDFAPSANAAGTRRRSEGFTLACAVAVAVTLGVVFGMWVTARLTPPTSSSAPAARLLPNARAAAPNTPAAPSTQPSPCDGCENSSTVEVTSVRVAADKADAGVPETASEVPKEAASPAPSAVAEPSPVEEVANVVAEPHGETSPEPVAEASPDPSRPVAWEVGSLPKTVARANVEHGAAQAPPEPCVPYASANSLNVRVGGAAPLILGGPGVGVRINVSTPDWSELAVVYEGPAGRNGWIRYSVKSIGRRPGRYTVRFSTPCGSQNIPVTVK
jgi:hypothetical protein